MGDIRSNAYATRNELRDAIWGGEIDLVRKILDTRPDLVNLPCVDYGQTPLMDAVGSTERTPELVRYLLDHGADVNACTREGYTALHCAVDVDGETCHGDIPETIIRMLVDAGADLEAKQHWGWTPLMRAIVEGVEDEVQALCNMGARVDHVFPNFTLPECMRGNTTLMASVYDPDKVKILLDSGADPCQRGLFGQNAIEYAEDKLSDVSQPENKRLFAQRMEQLHADIQNELRAFGISEEYVTGRNAIGHPPECDFESDLKESLRAMRSATQ